MNAQVINACVHVCVDGGGRGEGECVRSLYVCARTRESCKQIMPGFLSDGHQLYKIYKVDKFDRDFKNLVVTMIMFLWKIHNLTFYIILYIV